VLVQYLRKRKGPKSLKRKNYGPKRGVLVAARFPEDDGPVIVGYSLCNLKLDRFDAERGIHIAFGRALCGSVSDIGKIPQSVQKEYELFLRRADRYFKNEKIKGEKHVH
jgi:hypothetical protein